jgi:AcrR family transcriptional regulator
MTLPLNPSRADTSRGRLAAAAVAAFAEKGFHGTTTRDIATAAGMSPAALYVHHRSKEEMLYLITLTGHQHTLATVRAGIASSDDPVQQLHRVVHDFAGNHARDHTTARIVNYELAGLSPEHLAEIRSIRQQTNAELEDLIRRGVTAGVFHTADPSMAATTLLSVGIDVARWYREDGRWSPEDIADYYADMGLRMVDSSRSPLADRP